MMESFYWLGHQLKRILGVKSFKLASSYTDRPSDSEEGNLAYRAKMRTIIVIDNKRII
jgi:hypothetical protein